jgi:hypothetical protein
MKIAIPNIYILMLIILLGTFAGFVISALSHAQASSIDDIMYPIAELGGCSNEQECRAYCDDLAHINECIVFAEEHNLMSRKEAAEARHFAKAGIRKGPGGCETAAQCQTYCENISNINECLAFAEKHGVISDEELREARQVAKALEAGASLPGGCTGKESCEAYCSDMTHIEECVAFAEAAGFMSPKELEEVKRIMPLMKSGQMPGGCASKEQCESYCEDENNFGECIAFAEKAGFVSHEEAEMARKTGGKGPGGCKGREECDAFCSGQDHMEECMAFAREHGLISDEELSHMREGMGRLQSVLKDASPEVVGCLEQNIDRDIVSKIQSGTFSPRADIGDKVRSCFEAHMPAPDFPPDVERCIAKVYGEGAMERIMSGEIRHDEIESSIGPCIENIMREQMEQQMMEGGMMEGMMPDGDEFHGGSEADEQYREEYERRYSEEYEQQREMIESQIRGERDGDDGGGIPAVSPMPTAPPIELNFPPQAKECLVRMYGSDYEQKLLKGEINPAEIQSAVQSCIEENIRVEQFQTSTVLESLKIFLRLNK